MINPLMSLAHSWESKEAVQNLLAVHLIQGRLALVLGSGVSVPFGLPDWKVLIAKMYQGVSASPDPVLTLPRQAEIFRLHHCGSDRALYESRVRDSLYERLSVDLWTHQPLLVAIGALVMASKRGNASDVITFNFDDILETYLEFHGFVVDSIISDKYWSGTADVRVFHPHGLIPSRLGSPSYEPVLDQTSFNSMLHGDRGRIWRKTLLGVMRTHTCIFIGLSGSDDNLESLLYECFPDHIAMTENLAFWGVRFSDSPDDSWRTLWGEKGVSTWVVDNYHRALPAFLLEICQIAAHLRAKGI